MNDNMTRRRAEPLYVFLHLPKCAGTTFSGLIAKHRADRERLQLSFVDCHRHMQEQYGDDFKDSRSN
jgi:hypothetical protein